MRDRDSAIADEDELQTQPTRSFSVPSYLRMKTVLLVEDQEEVNRSLSIRLASEGFNVVSAYDGLNGLNKMRTEEPDLVLLDLRLPRLHGFKLLHRLRMTPGILDVPIIVLTGDPDPEIEDKCEKWGVSKVFRKPTRQAKIVQAIRDVLDGD